MKAEILTIGDELLIGQVINTNQAYIAEQLNAVGVHIERMTTAGDEQQSIVDACADGLQRVDVVVVTGGLGPTHDDVTKRAMCRLFETDLVSREEVRKNIETLLERRGIPWSAAVEEQTLMPRSATVVPNPAGTAAGMLFERGGKYLFVLPGVPYEMKEMVDRSIVPFVAERVRGSVIRHLTLRTSGITESMLARQLGSLDEILRGVKLAFLPSPTGVRLRITAHAKDATTAEDLLKSAEQRIRTKVQRHIYGINLEEIEEVVGSMLAERHLTLAIAESCTGGLISDRITDVGGSSAYFERGIVAYSNNSKIALLGVPQKVLDRYGAVSKETAEAMARGVRKLAGTDLGLSTTGIAGPTGGSKEKPVGLVWMGYADAEETVSMQFNFGDHRRRIKERAAQSALELLRKRLLKID